ncbi:MAG: hypothetical protein ABJE66_29795 [Deltaproteobacteria bacterium]
MSSEIFRDRTEGTAAKRQELLRRRRDELVTMPHAVRRVVVARSARIAASMAITLGGVALIATAYSPSLTNHLASVMPGIQPAPLSTLLSGSWIIGLVAWAISRARVEHRFAVAMSKYVLPSNDLDHDVERLDHERPDHIARTMGHDLEVRSAAWPILAAGVIVPATALWIGRIIRTHSWPVMSEFEVALAMHAKALALIGLASTAGAIAMTRKALRQPVTATLALPFGLVATAVTFVGFAKGTSYAWALCGVAVVVVTMGFIARTLRDERALLEIDDPAAGSELFTIRGALRELRASVRTAGVYWRRVPLRARMLTGVVALLGCAWGAVHYWRGYVRDHASYDKVTVALAQHPQLDVNELMPAPVNAPNPNPNAPVTSKVDRIGNRFWVEAMLDANGEAVIPMAGFKTLPENWHATLAIEMVSSDPLGFVGENNEVRYLSSTSPRMELAIDACKGARALAVRVQQPHSPNKKITFWVVPTLTLATCH